MDGDAVGEDLTRGFDPVRTTQSKEALSLQSWTLDTVDLCVSSQHILSRLQAAHAHLS